MTRRTTVAALVGAVLATGLAGPALAGPLGPEEDGRETVCLRLEGESGAREGVCVWVPVPG